MRYGVTIFATDRSIDIVELARAAEERDLESLWVPEHTHIPVSRRTPSPTGDPELPEQYRRTLDPFVALTAAAVVTERLRVGTGIALVAQRDPIVTAKAAASLDHISGGRFSLGVGVGWNKDEMEDHGVAYRRRRALAREHILAMQRLWADDEATFAGKFVRMPPSWSWPKPVQRNPNDRPAIPVLLGGAASPRLFTEVAEYGDGWIPIGGSGLANAIPALRDRVEEAGRDQSTVEIVSFGSIPDHGKLDHFERIGVTECAFQLPSAPRDEVLPVLDTQAKLVAERRGA